MLVFGKLSLLRGACLFQRQELLQSSHKVHGKLFVFSFKSEQESNV